MPDFSTSIYSPNDNLNGTRQPPDGFPTGTLPTKVAGTLRALMGAGKRGFDALNVMVTAGGTATAVTLTYEVAPASPHPRGVVFWFWASVANTGPATMSVNGIGPHQLVDISGAALSVGALIAGNPYSATFDGTRFRLSGGLTKADLDSATTKLSGELKKYADDADAVVLKGGKDYADGVGSALKTYTDTAVSPLLKRAGDRLTGALSSAVKAHGTLSGTITETFSYTDANTHSATIAGAVTINPANLAEGDTLQINVLFQSGTISVAGTTQWELGGGLKSAALADTGVTLVANTAYRIVFEVVAGVRTGIIL